MAFIVAKALTVPLRELCAVLWRAGLVDRRLMAAGGITMTAPTDVEFVLRVLLATACGAAIGMERQYRSRTAGLRTQALVAAGAAAFVLFGEQTGVAPAPLQIAAYVVSGVGFLGGGVILRQGFTVQGLNTAATLWCSAAVGCQAAGGHLIPALALTVLILSIHTALRPIGRLVDRVPAVSAESVGAYTVQVEVLRDHEPHVRAQVLQALAKPDVTVRGVAGRTVDEGSNGAAATVLLRLQIEVEGSPERLLDGVVSRLSLEPGVRTVSWQAEDDGKPFAEDMLDAQLPRWRRLRSRRAAT